MKSKLTNKQKTILLGLISIGVIWGLMKTDDYLRRDGIPENQEMTLIKKEILKRKVDITSNDYGEGYLPAKEYAKLSFDTDGNTNTAEVTIVPEEPSWKGIDEVKSFKIGEKRTLKNWNNALEQAASQRCKALPYGEEYDRTALFWQWQKERK